MTSNIRKILLSFILLLLSLTSKAYILTDINLGYGSSQYSCAAQDPIGMMWIGSNRGLFFYDGFRPYPVVLNGNYIHSLTCLPSRLLCVADDKGAYLVDVVAKKRIPSPLDKASLGRCRASCAVGNKVWIGSEKRGLVEYDLKSGRLRYIKTNIGECYALAQNAEEVYVGGTNGMGRYRIRTQRWERIHLPGMQDGLVGSLLWDRGRHTLWVGLWRVLYQYQPQSGAFKQELSFESSFKSMDLDVDGQLLIGTDNGLLQYSPNSGSTMLYTHDTRNPQSICNDVVLNVFQDRSHNMWIGTNNGITLMQYAPHYQYMPIQMLVANLPAFAGQGNCFTTMFVDSRGNCWMGGTNGLLLKTRDGKVRWYRKESATNHLPNNCVRRIYEDREAMVWIATDEGVLHYDAKTQNFVPHRITDLTGRYHAVWVYDIYEDERHRLWLATYGQTLYIVDKSSLLKAGSTMLRVTTLSQLSPRASTTMPLHAYTLIEGGGGQLWVGHQQGLSLVNTRSLEGWRVPIVDDSGRLAHSYISNLIKGDNGFLWYSYKNVVCKLDTRTKRSQRVFRLPLANEYIRGMAFCRGRLWMLLSNMLCVLDTRTMQYNELSLPVGLYQSIFYNEQSSRFILGGNDAVLTVSPHVLSVARGSRRLKIAAIWGNNHLLYKGGGYEEVVENGKPGYRFPPGLSQLSFDVSDFSFNNTAASNIEYSLNGGSWVSLPVGDNRITFLNLSPGHYTLSIRENAGAAACAWHFEVMAPWYLSDAAYVVYALIFLAALYSFVVYLYRRNRRKYEEMERKKSLELSNMKIDFFTNMSHELKTPLSLIIAPLHELLMEKLPKETAETLQTVYKNALRLHTLIRQILDFKRMESHADEQLTLSTVNLSGLLSSCVSSFSEAAQRRQISITVKGTSEPLMAEIDVFKIESVVYNLLSNAMKYVSNGTGSITISLQHNKTARTVTISVADNGPGIPAARQPLVWVRQYRGSNYKLNPYGNGIGLYLVKHFVELHGGRVLLESTPGKGSTFIVTLPVNVHQPAAIDSADRQATAKTGAPLLLIADDNEEQLNFLVSVLQYKYRCLKACNGRQALELAMAEKPDVVVADEMMPVMTGMKFCTELRKLCHLSNIAVIMLTAKDDASTQIESMKAGADAFMAKPFDMDMLKARIAQLLESRRRRMEKENVEQAINQAVCVKGVVESEDEKLMKKVVEAIESHMGDFSFNVTALGTYTGIGSKRLLRLIKQQTGSSPVAFIRSMRIRKAARLLRSGKFSVSEVMYMVGFTHSSYFSKSFEEEFHVTPKTYLEREKNK